ncbi:MAG: hypothetical protein NEHIOOID_00292 [Holosporales bacterium]
MTLIPSKKILTKAAFMAMLCFCNMLTAAAPSDLQRRDSFKKLEDLRAKQKEDAGDRVLYEKRDGGFRPHGLMDDITEPGQSSRIMSAMADEQSDGRHQDRVQNESVSNERRNAFSQMPREYEQGAVDTDRRYQRKAAENVRRHQDAVQNQGRVSYQDFMRMTDQQIKNVREVVIPLSESYFANSFDRDQRSIDLGRQLEKNQNITVVLDCAGASRIDHRCLECMREMRKLKIIHAENVENIGNNFLDSCSGLTTLDLSPLSNVTRIGTYFLSFCEGLTTLDLSAFSNVREIEDSFLSDCIGLTTLDLRPLSNVRNIDNYFLAYCEGLTTLDLSPLSNVTRIGNYFLSRCFGLTREHVTVPQNWRFEDCLPENLRQPRAAEPTQNARPAPVNPQRMIDDLRERHIDPKRPGSDYTSMEFGMAGALMQGAEQSQNGCLKRLESVFSAERAFMLLQDITIGDDHSSDSDSDHSDR